MSLNHDYAPYYHHHYGHITHNNHHPDFLACDPPAPAHHARTSRRKGRPPTEKGLPPLVSKKASKYTRAQKVSPPSTRRSPLDDGAVKRRVSKAKLKDVKMRNLETALLHKSLDVLDGKNPSERQKRYMEAECVKIGLKPARAKWTRWFNKERELKNQSRRSSSLKDDDLSEKDYKWLKRFVVLKEIGSPMAEGEDMDILDSSTFKLDDWEPEIRSESPYAVFCYVVPSKRKIVCRWTEDGLYKRCVILAGHVIAQLNPSNSGFNLVSETDAPGDNFQQLVLGRHPAYQTWAPSMDEHGDIDWQWDDSPSIIGMGDVPRITFKGGSTLAMGLDIVLQAHKLEHLRLDGACPRCPPADSIPIPSPSLTPTQRNLSAHYGNMSPNTFWTLVNTIDNIERDKLVSALSSGNEGDGEASTARKTISNDGTGLITMPPTPQSTCPVELQRNIFDRMKPNNELGQAILDRWTGDVAATVVRQASHCMVRNFQPTVPQHMDDIFGIVNLAQVLPPTEAAVFGLAHIEEGEDFFSGFEAQFMDQDLIACKDTEQAPMIEPDTSWDSLDLIPELVVDRRTSLSTAQSLPLITPSQSLEVLHQLDLICSALPQQQASDPSFMSTETEEDEAIQLLLGLQDLENHFQAPSLFSLEASEEATGFECDPTRLESIHNLNCLGIALQNQDIAGTEAETQQMLISRYEPDETD